ncbi:MAG: ATP-grasp domain-containing protein [Spirochaetaceae bacterium]|nr:MAG: ATP-grasp domain-containing protein [Spirochaetaceae bacterium]
MSLHNSGNFGSIENGPTILVLGASLMQRPAYEAAQRRGWRAVAVDRDPHSISRAHAADFIQADISNHEEVTLLASEYATSHPVHGVFTCGTDFSYTVAVTAARLGLPGMPPEAALRASNKKLMRDCFHQAGIPSPRHHALSDLTDESLAAGATELGFPLVVKPVDNMGARGIRLVHDKDQLETAVRLAVEQSRTGRVILEQLIDGLEYSIDALVFDGRIVIVGVADRHIFFPPYFVEMGHTIPTMLSGSKYTTLIEGFRSAVRALGIEYGAAKGDVFLSNGEAVVGEIAARLSGGYMSGWTFPAAARFEPVEAAMELALGFHPRSLPDSIDDVQPQKTSAERAWISIPGTVKEVLGLPSADTLSNRSVDGAAELPMKDGEVELIACFPRATPGDSVSFPTNNVEKCGNIITCSPQREKAVQQAETITRAIVVRLEPGNARTFDFLFGSSGHEAPWAFWPTHRENVDCLADMPRFTTSAVTPSSEITSSHTQHRGNCRTTISVGYLPLPHPERETAPDYNGHTLCEVLDLLRLRYKVAPQVELTGGQSLPGLVLGRVFWRALLKGGLQGALFIIDTISRDVPSHEELARLTGRLWNDDFAR